MMRKAAATALAAVLMVSVGMNASAAPITREDSYPAQGYIGAFGEGDGNGQNQTIDVRIPAEIMWQINENHAVDSQGRMRSDEGFDENDIRKYLIGSGTFSFANNSVNKNYAVTLKSFEETAGNVHEVADDITLKLTGDLAHEDAEDLLRGVPAEGIRYDRRLNTGDTWTFGFEGEYIADGLDEVMVSDYAMIIEYELVSINAGN